MGEKFISTAGVFAGIFNEDGKLLLRRRTLPEEKKSLISDKTVKRDWELPGGIVEQEEMLAAGDERGLVNALKREIKEELGLEIDISIPLTTFPVVLSKEISGKIVNDIALLVVVGPKQWKGKPKGEITWVHFWKLKKLAENPPGEQLLSGWGKRMCRMALIALLSHYSQPLMSDRRAREALAEIYSTSI